MIGIDINTGENGPSHHPAQSSSFFSTFFTLQPLVTLTEPNTEKQNSCAEITSIICTNTIEVLVVIFPLYILNISLCASWKLSTCLITKTAETDKILELNNGESDIKKNHKTDACPKLESSSEKEASFAPSS